MGYKDQEGHVWIGRDGGVSAVAIPLRERGIRAIDV